MITTKWSIHGDQDLVIWETLSLCLDIRWRSSSVPSWVPDMAKGRLNLIFAVPYVHMYLGWRLATCDARQMTIEDDTVHVHGYIQDLVTVVSPNFSNDAAKDALLHAYDNLKPSTDVLARNPSLKALPKAYPQLQREYPDQVTAGLTVQDLCSSDTTISSYLHNASKGQVDDFWNRYHDRLYPEHLCLGRNLFTESQGYIGVGPAGSIEGNSPQIPAAQVRDCIAIIANSNQPFILRPRNDSSYAIVGVAYIG
jgi:hypothetical protein